MNLYEKLDLAKKNIHSHTVESLVEITKNFENIKSLYSGELVELIGVFEDFQKDTAFAYDEGKAVGKYFKLKGYSREHIDMFIEGLLVFFN